jgi:hypothetical protein
MSGRNVVPPALTGGLVLCGLREQAGCVEPPTFIHSKFGSDERRRAKRRTDTGPAAFRHHVVHDRPGPGQMHRAIPRAGSRESSRGLALGRRGSGVLTELVFVRGLPSRYGRLVAAPRAGREPVAARLAHPPVPARLPGGVVVGLQAGARGGDGVHRLGPALVLAGLRRRRLPQRRAWAVAARRGRPRLRLRDHHDRRRVRSPRAGLGAGERADQHLAADRCALGLAVLATIATSRTDGVIASAGSDPAAVPNALTEGSRPRSSAAPGSPCSASCQRSR